MSDTQRSTPDAHRRYVIGCMTGTSLDGLDAALVEIRGRGLAMSVRLLGWQALDLGDLREPLMHLANGNAAPPLDVMRAARRIGQFYGDGIEELLKTCPVPNPSGKPDFVVAHGQTIWHAPFSGESQGEPDAAGMSWQLFDPWPIVRRLGLPVCYDLRQADLIAGGQGAPLTPLADWVIYREHANMIVNLGGVMNITYWKDSAATIEGGDVCPCNLLLDGLAKRLFDMQYDADDQLASQGEVVESIVQGFTDRFCVQGFGEASLGREQLTPVVFDSILKRFGSCSPHDVLRSAIEYVVRALDAVCQSVAPNGVVLGGGGARHRILVEESMARNQAMKLFCLSDDLSIPCEAREAMGWAVLGALSQDGVPISLPQVTGSTNPGVAGVWAGTSI